MGGESMLSVYQRPCPTHLRNSPRMRRWQRQRPASVPEVCPGLTFSACVLEGRGEHFYKEGHQSHRVRRETHMSAKHWLLQCQDV